MAPKGTRKTNYPYVPLEGEFLQLLIGSLLGDGSFDKVAAGQSHLVIAHSVDKEEYLVYKRGILEGVGLANSICRNRLASDRYKLGYCDEVRTKSKGHPVFSNIRSTCYGVDGKKSINKELVGQIEALGLAIWFMDDGNVTPYGFQFNTQSFSSGEKEYLRSLLSEKFGLGSSVHKQGQIYIPSGSRDAFVEIVKPYVIPCMAYKLVPYRLRVLNKPGELMEPLLSVGNHEPSLLNA